MIRHDDVLEADIFSKNMHEVACVSGVAAAYRLGATYDAFDEFATDFFSKYLLLTHGMRYKSNKK